MNLPLPDRKTDSGSPRENIVNIILGDRFAGKTTYIITKLVPAYLQTGKHVYIFMRKYNAKYDQFKGHKYVHVYVVTHLSEILPMLEVIYNSAIIMEDAYRFFGNKLTEEVIGCIIDTQQQNNDIHFVYHVFSWICRDLCRIFDCLTAFGCTESAGARSDFFSESEIKLIDSEIIKLKPYESYFYRRQ